jgi:hypothetical protein
MRGRISMLPPRQVLSQERPDTDVGARCPPAGGSVRRLDSLGMPHDTGLRRAAVAAATQAGETPALLWGQCQEPHDTGETPALLWGQCQEPYDTGETPALLWGQCQDAARHGRDARATMGAVPRAARHGRDARATSSENDVLVAIDDRATCASELKKLS